MTFTVPQDGKALAKHDMGSVNFTGITVNGFAVSEARALMVGLSVPNGHKVAGSTGHSTKLIGNVYLSSTDTTGGGTKLVWLTKRKANTKEFVEEQPALVPLENGDFAVIWDELHGEHVTMNYRLVDETGRVLASRRWSGHAFAAVSQPVLAGSRILWVGEATAKGHYRARNQLYGLSVANPASPSLLGH